MGMLIANILLALVWALMFDNFSVPMLLIGMVLGYIALRIAAGRRRDGARAAYFDKVWTLAGLFIFFCYELVRANISMAYWTLSPLGKLRPAILAVPLAEDMSDVEITILANMITLTPGTLSLDVSTDRTHLFVHFMNVADPEKQIREIKEGFERRLLAVTREELPQSALARRSAMAAEGADEANLDLSRNPHPAAGREPRPRGAKP